MRVKCDYCEKLIDENLTECPFCGAAMPAANRTSPGQPKTIEELKQWYKAHNLPDESITRFFIGKDIKEAKAFGIYKNDSGDFVVYKNKANGDRAVRYQGTDEGYAVNEIYQRLRAEIADRKTKNAAKSGSEKMTLTDWLLLPFILPLINPIFATIYVIIAVALVMMFDHSPSRGYYNYDGNDYYYQDSTWYSYDASSDEWGYASNSDILDSIINDDTDSEYQTVDHDGTRFEDTNWYDSGSSDDSYDWDSDSTWDDSSWDSSDSWDSGGSDWDSDW